MASSCDHVSQPVAVTGLGVVTSLGVGKADNWQRLIAGQSGIRRITRFATEALRTTIAGTVDFVPVEPFCSTSLSERLADMAAEEAIAEAAICIGADGSVNPESLIRFSLLSALSTANDPPQAAAKPFSKNRDGFVMAEGAGALVLENLDHAKARGAKILGVIEGCGEMADSFHRTRSSPDGKPIIGCRKNAIADAGLTPEDIDSINAPAP